MPDLRSDASPPDRSRPHRRRRIYTALAAIIGVLIVVVVILALDESSPQGPRLAAPDTSAEPTAETSPSPSPTETPVELIDDGVVSVKPKRVRPGETITFVIKDPPGAYGLAWFLDRQNGSEWTYIGAFRAGPPRQWKDHEFNRFYFLPEARNLGIESVTFHGNDSIDLNVPRLEPGTYRIATSFQVKREDEWHIDLFEVVES